MRERKSREKDIHTLAWMSARALSRSARLPTTCTTLMDIYIRIYTLVIRQISPSVSPPSVSPYRSAEPGGISSSWPTRILALLSALMAARPRPFFPVYDGRE